MMGLRRRFGGGVVVTLVIGVVGIASLVALAVLGRTSDAIIGGIVTIVLNEFRGHVNQANIRHGIEDVRNDVSNLRRRFNGGLRDAVQELMERPSDLPAHIRLRDDQEEE